MKFVKNIRDNQVEFSVVSTEDNVVSVQVVIPPYGSYKRGENYMITELNQLVLQEIDQSLIPVRTEGRHKAFRREAKIVHLDFKKAKKKNNTSFSKQTKAKEPLKNKNTPRATRSKKR